MILIENDFKFLLILSVKNPKIEDWDEGVKVFNDKFPNYNLKSLTDPNVYEDSYYLGLLSVSNDSVLNWVIEHRIRGFNKQFYKF